jgi:hypothetical protein
MFFIGLASMMLIAYEVIEQFLAERSIGFRAIETSKDESNEDESNDETIESDPESVLESKLDSQGKLDSDGELPIEGSVRSESVQLAKNLCALPNWMRDHYLWQRLMAALNYLDRTQDVTGVEEELKYLSELDLERQQNQYSLVRILIWATPMLGFLGTVLGISQALGGINVGPDNDFQQMMNGLRGSLYIAFDTTALALTLSMVLMFVLFLVERFETQLLSLVDQRTRMEVARNFDLTSTATEQIGAQFLEATRESVVHQTELWRKSIRSAEQAWTASLSQVNDQVQSNLSEAIDENVASLAHYLGQAIDRADNSMAQRWEQWQVTLSENARLMSDHQNELGEQSRLLVDLIEQSEKKDLFLPAIKRHQEAVSATENLQTTLVEIAESLKKHRQSDPVAVEQETSQTRTASAIAMPTQSVKEIVNEMEQAADGPVIFKMSDIRRKKKRRVVYQADSSKQVLLPNKHLPTTDRASKKAA